MRKKSSDFDFIRRRLREIREKAGWTQEQAAEKAGISSIYYQSIEAGRRNNPRFATLSEVVSAYGLSMQEFMADKVPEPKVKRSMRPTPHKGRSRKAKPSD